MGKHICSSLYLIKLQARVFSCEYCQIFKNTFFKEHLQMTASKVRGENGFALIRLFYIQI